MSDTIDEKIALLEAENAQLREENMLMLEEMLKAKQRLEFNAGKAHDIKGLLTVVFVYADECRRITGLRPDVKTALEDIQSSASRTLPMLNSMQNQALLACSMKKKTNIYKLSEWVVGYLCRTISTRRMNRKGRPITLDISGDRECVAAVDTCNIEEALFNLGMNAIQAIEENGGNSVIFEVNKSVLPSSYTIRGSAAQPGPYATISVTDDGGGIPEENLGSIFTPYFTTKKKGTGLGLHMVKSIVSAHDGYIDVSTAGRSTTFKMYIPMDNHKG